MKKKLLMALLVGVLAVPSSVSCFAAESTDAAAADSDEEEETEETEAEDKALHPSQRRRSTASSFS